MRLAVVIRAFCLTGLLCLTGILAATGAIAQDEPEETEASKAPEATQYVDLKPAFVVNYGGAGRLRYLKTEISLRVAAGPEGASAIRHHMPYIRHTLVMLLSRASQEDLSSMEGREMLRQEALEAVREVLVEEEGEQQVVDLLFNSFVVQR